MPDVVFLNPRTCGIYKNGAPRYKTDRDTGLRTEEIDNELLEAADDYIAGRVSPGEANVPIEDVWVRRVLVPMYYDERHNEGIAAFLDAQSIEGITIGELLDSGVLSVRSGHGSPPNDQRTGHIPYVKVSDIRALRVNVNPTNLVSRSVAERFWRGTSSGLQAWDVLTPNRASSNIGEFAILLPGEEQIVLTKEMFIFRVVDEGIWDPFFLMWALSLRPVREQWRRIALMQTNREDCGDRYREIILPRPPSVEWVLQKSCGFRDYFQSLAEAAEAFHQSVSTDGCEYIACVRSASLLEPDEDEPADELD